MDVELIVDAAEDEAPGLRYLAPRFLQAEAGRLGASLEVGDVLARRAGGVPEVHVTAAADLLLAHLVAIGLDVLDDGSAFMALARAGARAMVTRAELEADRSVS